PNILVSRCLGFDACRYDGAMVEAPFVQAMRPYAKLLTVCPEVEIGMGIPRDPIRIVQTPGGRKKLYQPATGHTLTRQMKTHVRQRLAELDAFDGVLLKSKSPSCGLGTCKLFESTAADARVVGRTSGVLAAEIERQCPGVPASDEVKVVESARREHWLTAVFTLAQFRRTARYESAGSLKKFHEYHRSLLYAYNKSAVREMDIIVGSARKREAGRALHQYGQQLIRCLQRPARAQAMVNALQPAVEHYRQYLTKQNLQRYDRLKKQVLARQAAIADLRKLIQVWAVRYDKNFVREHALYRPYPQILADA
ncbi:DUF1722 domain-containing protein, partial [candidate division GN15 bacterium]|nr:DUF1722 domain-containing protein [candidate division GN15 bacterium]